MRRPDAGLRALLLYFARMLHSLAHRSSTNLIMRLLFCILTCALAIPTLGVGAPGANPTTSDEDSVTQSEVAAIRASTPPVVTSRAAVVMDSQTGRVLLRYNGARRLPMASTVKMMTALLAAELADPEEEATVYPRDLRDLEGGIIVYLRPGERMTIQELLYSALLPSGNDAAVTIADHVGRKHLGAPPDGGVNAFIQAMNDRAGELGLTNTRFKTPHGFDMPGQYSTAEDLAILGREVLKHPLLADIVATRRYKARGFVGVRNDLAPVYHPLETTNELLGTYRGANGIKTGTTAAAGENLVASAARGNSRLIAVVLGSTDRFSDARTLLDWGFNEHDWLRLSGQLFPLSGQPGEMENAPPFAAVEPWNADMLLFLEGGDSPNYWVGTEPLDVVSAGDDG